MTKTSTTIWDSSTHLRTTDDVAAYLEAALQDGDPQLVAAALGDIARAKGMSQVARDAGLGRESLYKSLSFSGNPELPLYQQRSPLVSKKPPGGATDEQ